MDDFDLDLLGIPLDPQKLQAQNLSLLQQNLSLMAISAGLEEENKALVKNNEYLKAHLQNTQNDLIKIKGKMEKIVNTMHDILKF